jgi:hypothetical protein
MTKMVMDKLLTKPSTTFWPPLTEYGMRPNNQIAAGEIWSALRFRTLNVGEARFPGGGR